MLRPASPRGFTLIEIAVVLVCLGLLAGIAVPTYNYFMDRTDVSVARAEAAALVRNAVGVSSLDGYDYYCPPMPDGDTTPFWQALEDVDSEQGTTVWAEPYNQWVDYLGVTQEGWGVIQVIGVRWTHYFLLDMCTGDLYDVFLDPGDSGGSEGGPPGGGGGLPFTLSYPDTSFSNIGGNEVLRPVITGGNQSTLTFGGSGTLPGGVTWNAADGSFTGPPFPHYKATQVDGSGLYGCAVTMTTEVICWGDNTNGQLGNGTASGFYASNYGPKQTYYITQVVAPGQTVGSTPVKLTGAAKVTVGSQYACALLLDGRVVCWGFNNWGKLGIGPGGAGVSVTADSWVPVPRYVVGVGEAAGGAPLQDVVDISTGNKTACAVKSNGTVVCWGFGVDGQLGDGVTRGYQSNAFSESPVQVIAPGEVAGGDPLTGAVQVSVANQVVCARLSDGKAVCWGANGLAALGIGERASVSVAPSYVLGIGEELGGDPLTGVADLATSDAFSCAVLQSGNLACWGDNWGEQLSVGTQDEYVLSPRLVLDEGLPMTGVESVSAGDPLCVLKTDTSVWCWGILDPDYTDTLGRGVDVSEADMRNPEPIAMLVPFATLKNVLQDPGVATGVSHLGHAGIYGGRCAAANQGAIYCWGGPVHTPWAASGPYLDSNEEVGLYVSFFPSLRPWTGSIAGFPSTLLMSVTDADGNHATAEVTLSIAYR